jgi:probable phosphomutase (TIGR03848 family)
MSRIVLLRHAHSVANEKGILSGRTEGISLSKTGATQADELLTRFEGVKFSAIRISPMQRCLETIEPWINSQDKFNTRTFGIDPQLTEIDFGTWTGKRLTSLSVKRDWKIVQNSPEKVKFPEGESLKQAQVRALAALAKVSATPGKAPKLVVTHADVIKLILCGILSSGLKDFQKFAVDPASATVIDFDKTRSRIILHNDTKSNLKHLLK